MDKDSINKLDINLKSIAKSSAIVFIGIILSKLFTYLYRIIIARNFGPEIYGLFSLAVMVVGWFVSFAALGFTSGLLRYISFYRGKNDFNKIRYVFQISKKILLISGILLGLLLFFSSDFIAINIFHNIKLSLILKIFSLLVPLSILSSVYLSPISAFEKIGWYSFIFNILQNIAKVASLIILIYLGFKSNSVFFSYVFAAFVTLTVSYIVCKKYIPIIFAKHHLIKKERNKLFSSLYSYSWPMLFSGIIYLLFCWTDIFIIGYFKEVIDVGIYNAAIPIALFLSLTPELFMALFFPLVTKEFSKKRFWVINNLSKQVTKWIFMINLPILILILLFSGDFIIILFGKDYLFAETALRFLAFGMFFNSIFIISEKLLSIIGKSKIVLLDLIITSVTNLILSVILVQRYGINGAAFSTMISFILLGILFLFQVKHYLGIIPLKRNIIKVFLVSLPPLFVLVFFRNFIIPNPFSIALIGLFFLLLYTLFLFLFGCLDKNDLMILRGLKNKFFPNKSLNL